MKIAGVLEIVVLTVIVLALMARAGRKAPEINLESQPGSSASRDPSRGRRHR